LKAVLRNAASIVLLFGLAGIAQAQTVKLDCVPLADLQASYAPPRLARAVKDCIAKERFDNAMQLFLVYSIYGTFDQQRVRDESGHTALVELNIWIFGGYPRSIMDQLRTVAERLRDHEDSIFRDTCAAIARLGPPDYQPDYLIGRGEFLPRKNADDWMTEAFDPAKAWQKALVEINQCPA
jgi:hypothetical protein